MKFDKKIDQQIIEIVLAENQRPIPDKIIFLKLRKKDKFVNEKIVYKTINELIEKKIFFRNKFKKIVMAYAPAEVDMSQVYEGTISINASNTGFITKEGETESAYYVHKSNLAGALDGDIVAFALLKKPKTKNLWDAKVLKIISHAKDFYTAEIRLRDNGQYDVILDDLKMYLPIKLDSIEGIVDKQKVLIKIKKYEQDAAYGSIMKVIGHVSDPGVDVSSLLYDNGVEVDFNDETINESREIKFEIDEEQKKLRIDLTHLPICTIDPATSKDFDDAIYVEKLQNNNFLLYVSIADVSFYVRKNTKLDETAFQRGCSIYLVDRVVPMLPHNLSDNICSLMPNEKRFAITCEMQIDIKGDFKNIKVYPSIIKSKRRFSYDEVNEYYDKKNALKNDSTDVKNGLDNAYLLSDILSKKKKQQGYIEFDIPEPIIKLDDQGFPIEINLRKTGFAQKMIENFMIAANEATTIYALKRKWPYIYRVHDEPSLERLETFANEAKKLNFKLPKEIKDVTPKTIASWLENNPNNPNEKLINILLLRSMAKAKYSEVNTFHFGLASENYTHFTSPIRRYPDLLVHRIFWMYEFDKTTSEQTKNDFIQELKNYCDQSSNNEVRAIKCERDTNSMKFAEYMTKHIGETFEGFVSGVSAKGVFVELPNTISGFVKINDLAKNDYFVYDEKRNIIYGQKTNKIFTLGTKVVVKVVNANKANRTIDFVCLEAK